MNWIRANYDRVSVLAGAVFLLLCAFFIWRSAATFDENFAIMQVQPHGKIAAPPSPALELAAAEAKLEHPPQWTFSGRSGLFVPEKHFIGPGGVPATLQNTQVHAPVPNEWIEQFGLPIGDADVLTQDPDGDQFTNLEEWTGHTNPTDKNSRPDYIVKLKLKSYSVEPFRLLFSSWNPTTGTFEINAIDLKEPTQFVKIGDTIAGTHFKVVKFTEKHQVNPATSGDMDVSELSLENQETHDRLTLVKEKVTTSPETVGKFIFESAQPQEFTIKKDQEFSLPPEPEIRYKLIDVGPDKAVIVNTKKPEERVEIGPVSP
jgi:hypothetical protein